MQNRNKTCENNTNMLKCMYTNIRSLMNKYKRDEIALMLVKQKIDILGITESWANENIEDAEINFTGY